MNTPDPLAQEPRSEPSRLLETLLEIRPAEHAGVIDPVALLFLMRAADQGSTVEQRLRVASELAISGVGSIPDDASDTLLQAVVLKRFHGEPELGVGAGRIPLRYWGSGRPWPWPFTTGPDGQSILCSVDETSQLSLAAGVHWSEPDDPLREVHPIALRLRSVGPNLHAERALRCVEATVLTGDPAELLERRRRFLSHPELRGRPELGSWVMHAMDPADLESPAFFRDVRSADGIEWIARAAMSLPWSLRRAVGRGLMPAFWHLLDHEVPGPWAPEAAALLAITAPGLALRRTDQITGARDLTPDDVEWLTGVKLLVEERLAIAEAYSEPLRPREWDTKRRSLLLPGAPDLPGSEELTVLVRGKAGAVLELDLSVFNEPLDTEDGRLICPYDAFEILDLLRATGRIAKPDVDLVPPEDLECAHGTDLCPAERAAPPWPARGRR